MRMIGLIKVHVGNKGMIGRLWKGERICIEPRAGDADLWIRIWERTPLGSKIDCG